MNPSSFNRKIKRFCLFSFVIINFSLLFTCSPTESIFKDQKITLEADEGVTEVWLTLSAEPVKANAMYTVKRDTALIFKGKLNKSDTLLYDSGLKPNENYQYTVYADLNGEHSPAVSVEIVTMDTTSHDFSWSIYEFGGQGGSSAFYDVAIIDENDIWAVGEIYTKDSYTYDSLGNWIDPYNAAHWDGEKWELKRIYFLYHGSNNWSPIRSIIAFSTNDIWFGAAIHWNGNNFETKSMNIEFPYRIHKMWGVSSKDFYIVGNSGAIAHYDGQKWTKIESGTDLPINDIFGINNNEVFLPACHIIRSGNDSAEKKLMHLNNNNISSEYWPYNTRVVASVWIDEKNMLYTCGGGIFRRHPNKIWKEFKIMDRLIMTTRIRGNASNDIYVAGHFGLLLHYNGSTWKQYTQFNEIDIFHSLDVKDNIAVGVGMDGAKAIIYKRN